MTFVDPLAVDKVLQSGDHRVDDKKVSFWTSLISADKEVPILVILAAMSHSENIEILQTGNLS